ncbi:MAG TPA: hypothetical protein VFU38_04410, partial [Candidatus Krumholzibacteria bacterium]|nr:hypothetical protein [Candidatus Krumholzibacteria bacterium]
PERAGVSRAHRSAALALAVVVCMAASAAAKRMTLTRLQLEAAGVARLSDALQLWDEWSPASNDGYTWMPSPRAIVPRSTSWSVVLNGHVLDLGVFDAMHLELVPVSIAEVDSIVFVDDGAAPGVSWESAPARIEIYTARATPGWTVGVTASGANETGDPGPYRYTPLATPNVDAIGPDASLWLSRGGRNWYASVSGAMMQHPFTDPAMRERTLDALARLRPGASEPEPSAPLSWVYEPTWPAVLRLSSSVRLGVRAGGGWHDVIGALADSRRYFHYSEPFGSEVPTDQRVLVGGLTGSFGAGAHTRIGYRGLASSKELTDQDDALVFDYDWTSRRLSGAVDATHRRDRTRFGVFVGADNRQVDTADVLSDDDDTFVRAGARVERSFGGGSRFGLEGAATSDGDESAASAALRLHWVVRPADTVRVRVAMQERLFTETDDLWLWSERGYDVLARNGESYSIDGPITRTRVTSADVGWSSSGMLGGVEVNAGLSRMDDAYVEQRDFVYDAADCDFDGATRVATGLDGYVATVATKLYHALGSQSGGIFSWAYVEEFDSDPDLGNVWQTVPRHRLRYTVWGRPRSSWRLWGRVSHYSATYWTDYRGVDGSVCNADGVGVTYHAHVGGATSFDAMIQHGMWRERFWIDVMARNVFDADLKYHPAGGSSGFTVMAQARLRWTD